MKRRLEAGRKPGLLFLLGLLHGQAQAAVEPFFEFDTMAHAEPVPIESFRGDWDAPLQSGGDALLHARLESGFRADGWTVSYVQRADYELQASPGAVALYHRARNRSSFAAGERFDLALSAWHLESRGLRVARTQTIARDLDITVGISLLEGTALTDGSVAGSAVASAEKDYDYQTQVDYRYSEDSLFDRDVGRPYGRGYSLDAAASGVLAQRLAWRVVARDLYGRMRWEAAPRTSAQASSDNKEYDADGYVRYQPALSGQEGHAAHAQRIHARGSVELVWRDSALWEWGGRVRMTEVQAYPGALARGHHLDWRWDFEILPRERVLGLGIGWRGLDLRWQADHWDASDAHFLSAVLSASHRFR